MQSRQLVSLITFFGLAADVLLPPSRSVTMARRRLETLPCGGGTPLASGIEAALRVAHTAAKVRSRS